MNSNIVDQTPKVDSDNINGLGELIKRNGI